MRCNYKLRKVKTVCQHKMENCHSANMPFTAVMVNKTIHWSGETLYASCHLEFPQCLTKFRSSPVRHKQKCAVLSASDSFHKCRKTMSQALIAWSQVLPPVWGRFRRFTEVERASVQKSVLCKSRTPSHPNDLKEICGTPLGWIHKTFNTMNFEERFLISFGYPLLFSPRVDVEQNG